MGNVESRKNGKNDSIETLVSDLTSQFEDKRVGAAYWLHIRSMSLVNKDVIREAGGITSLITCLGDAAAPVRGRAVQALGNLASCNNMNSDAIREAGGIASLVTCLRDPYDFVRNHAVEAVLIIVNTDRVRNRGAIQEAGGSNLLVKFLSNENAKVRNYAATALAILIGNASNRDEIIKATDLASLVACLLDSKDAVREYAAWALANLAYDNATNHDAIREASGIAPLISYLADASADVRRFAARALVNLACNATNKDAIREASGIGPLIGCLADDNADVRKQAAVALANLTNNAANRDAIREAGGLDPLIGCLTDANANMRHQAAWVLCNLAINAINKDAIREASGIEPLIGCLTDASADVRYQTVRTLANLANNVTNQDAIREASGIAPLIGCLTDASVKVRELAAEALDALKTNNLKNQQAIRLAKEAVSAQVSEKPVAQELKAVDKYQSGAAKHSKSPLQSTLAVDTAGGGSKQEVLSPMSASVTKIPYAQISYHQTDFIAAGGFGKVYKATWQGAPVAFKILTLQDANEQVLGELQHESAMMAALRHPNVIDFYGICMEPGHYGMVMAYMPKGSLYTVLHNEKEQLDWPAKLNIAKGVCNGVAFLHDRSIMHRDFKSLNVLMNAMNTPKLCDFGLAKLKQETTTQQTQGGAMGTLAWMAPELTERGRKYAKPCDIFSLAVVLWELASRKQPWADAMIPAMIPMWVLQGKREEIPAETPSPFAALIAKCWAQKPEARPVISQVVEELNQLTV